MNELHEITLLNIWSLILDNLRIWALPVPGFWASPTLYNCFPFPFTHSTPSAFMERTNKPLRIWVLLPKSFINAIKVIKTLALTSITAEDLWYNKTPKVSYSWKVQWNKHTYNIKIDPLCRTRLTSSDSLGPLIFWNNDWSEKGCADLLRCCSCLAWAPQFVTGKALMLLKFTIWAEIFIVLRSKETKIIETTKYRNYSLNKALTKYQYNTSI